MIDHAPTAARPAPPVIYAAHFGFSEAPFAISPDPRYLYRSEHHREALAHLLYSVEEGGGFVQLTGEVGTGKTTMCRTFMESVPPHVDVALVLNPMVTGLELVATVCDELGVPYPAGTTSLKVLIDALYRHLLDAHARGRRTVLVVDEAQDLSVDVLEEVRLLTNLETARTKLLQVILAGQPELIRLLDQPRLRQLAQRVTARYHLGSLSRDETRDYIRHRLTVAGGHEGIFSPGAIRAVHRVSGGTPRLINVVCDRALLGAYSEGRSRVDTTTALRAAAEVFGSWAGFRPSRTVRRVLVATAVGAGLAAAAFLGLPGRIGQLFERSGRVDVVASPRGDAAPADRSRGASLREAAVGAPRVSGPPTTVAAAGPGGPGRLADVLRDGAAGDSERTALSGLLARWGLRSEEADGTPPCDRAGRQGLQCTSRTGSWRRLRHLALPAVLPLVTPAGDQRYAVLTALGEDHATLEIGGRALTLPLREIDTFWEGAFTAVWKPPAGRKLPIMPGSRGSDVVWLRERMGTLDGRSGEAGPRDLYDGALKDRVMAFQRSRGLIPDGVVGMETVSQLRAAAGEPGIPWLPEARP